MSNEHVYVNVEGEMFEGEVMRWNLSENEALADNAGNCLIAILKLCGGTYTYALAADVISRHDFSEADARAHFHLPPVPIFVEEDRDVT